MPLEKGNQVLNKTVSGFQVLNKTLSGGAMFPGTESSLKHNFASLSQSRKWNFNSLYSKSTMNKFKKRN